MDVREILSKVDHTLLKPDASFDEMIALCEDAMKYGVASVCVPPAYVARVRGYLEGRVPICTVIGFPNGYSSTFVKVFETTDAVRAGADEIDVVVNLGLVKDGDWDGVLAELHAVRDACAGKIMKVIIETALLTEEEKVELCRIVSNCRADYIKTSTGFASGGATREDVALLKSKVAPHVKVKAAGGIKTLQDAEDFINLGADRLGTSSIVRIVKEQNLLGLE